MSDTEPGLDSYAEAYGVVCDAVERAWHHWPVEPADGMLHTSDYARQAANRVMAAVEPMTVALDSEDTVTELRDLCERKGWDFSAKAETGHECAWGAEIRVTREPNRTDQPDRSLTTYAAGGGDAAQVLAEAAEDMLVWLAEYRDVADIRAAQEEFFSRLWYYRALSGDRTAADLAVAADGLARVESAHPDAKADLTDYELGVITGKLSALRWVLGCEWDMLDT